jgi:hypothetical protein
MQRAHFKAIGATWWPAVFLGEAFHGQQHIEE